MRQAKLNTSVAASAALEGDVLRAVSCTCIVYSQESLIVNIKPPQRHIVVYGADSERWPSVVTALKRGLVADGPVTLVLERRVEST